MIGIIIIITLSAVMAILVIAAVTDIKHRRIPNILSLIMVGLYGVFALSAHLPGSEYQVDILNGLLIGGIMLTVGMGLFALGAMGAGDIKLAAALSLFAGSHYIAAVLILITLSGGLIAGATWAYRKLRTKQNKVDVANRVSVPYGVAISISGIWLCIQHLGAVSFA